MTYSRQKIIDEFTDLPVSRQRKWQLRHPEKQKKLRRKNEKSLKHRVYAREWNRKKFGSKRRQLGAKSYQEENRLKGGEDCGSKKQTEKETYCDG